MSAVNSGLDQRAYRAQLLQENKSLREANAELRAKVLQLEMTAEDKRLLRGFTKLVLLAHYDEQDELLTITPLEMHSDTDVSNVWLAIRRAKRQT